MGATWGQRHLKRALAGLGAVVLLGTGIGVATTADAAPDRCASARSELANQRAEMVGLRAAYAISVREGYEYNVSRLGPRMVAGETETTTLLLAMYAACEREAP